MRLLSALLLMLSLSPAQAAPAIREGRIDDDAGHTHPLDARPGEFIHGRFEGRGLRLVLIDGDGLPVRVLAKGERDHEEFMLVAGPRPSYAVTIQAKEEKGRTYRLQVDEAVTQKPAPVPADFGPIASPRLRAVLASGDSTDLWAQAALTGGPLVETTGIEPPLPDNRVLLTFLWRGPHDNVWLFSAPSGRHDRMRRLGDTDVWFASYVVPDSTRMTYKIAPDVPDLDLPTAQKRRLILATVQRDPLNPRHFPDQVDDIFDGESVLELAKAPPQPWTGRRREVPAGRIERLRLESPTLGNQRDMLLYRPAGYVADAPDNALLVLFDAEFYQDRADIAVVLDNLNHARVIPPTAAILIANPSNDTRSVELPPNPAFARFLAQEAMPWAKAHGISAPADRTVIAGSSYGGLAAAYAGLSHPQWFGNVLSQSGSFWWAPRGEPPQWLDRYADALPRQDVRFHLEAGLFESGDKAILETTRHLRDVLRAKGYDVRYRDYAGGHDLIRWRATLATGLIDLLAAQSPASQDTSAVNR